MHAQASLPFPHLTKAVYRPRGINAIQLLFKPYFQSIAEQYESKYAVIYGRFRIERITEVVEKFNLSPFCALQGSRCPHGFPCSS